MMENDFREKLLNGKCNYSYAVVYARYSCDRQNEQSIDGQLRVCQDYAERNGIKIVKTYIDKAMTGTNDNREAFQRMLKDSDKKEWQYVLIYKLDRFSRNKYEMAIHRKHLKDNGVKILSAMENIPDTPEGTLLESLLEGINQYYSEELSQKTKRGMNETRLKGNFIGGIPNYGYSLQPVMGLINGKQVQTATKVIINKEESAIVHEIFSEYIRGEKIIDIAKNLNARGLRNRGQPFLRTTLYNILRQEKYSGIYRVNGNAYDKIYPPIITAEMYQSVKTKLDANKHGKHTRNNTPYLLKGKMFCGCCGKRMNSGAGTSKSGKSHRYYVCPRRESCEQKRSLRKDVLEQAIITALDKLLRNQKNFQAIIDIAIERYNNKANDVTDLKAAEKELSKTERSLSNLLAAIEAGMLTETTRERLTELELTKKELKELIAIEKSKEIKLITANDIRQFVNYALSQPTQVMIELLVQKIIVVNDIINLYLRCAKDTPPDDTRKRLKKNILQNPDGTISDRGFLFMEFKYNYDVFPNGRNPLSRIKIPVDTITLTIKVYL